MNSDSIAIIFLVFAAVPTYSLLAMYDYQRNVRIFRVFSTVERC